MSPASGAPSSYPMIDMPLPLAGGGEVQLFNLIIPLERAEDGAWRAVGRSGPSERGH